MKLFCSELKKRKHLLGKLWIILNYGKNILYIRYEVLKKVFNNRRSC